MSSPGSPPRLPAQSTRFVGRRREVAQARRLLRASRMLTLTGPPGVGKTRLALRTAETVGEDFPDGVCWAELGGLRDPALVAQEIAGAFGLHDASIRWVVSTLAQHVGDRELLLVLDNCEHLLDACAVLVDSLVGSCPNLHVVATSRQSLRIGSETILPVPPLSLPEIGSVESEAVELLLVRAASLGLEKNIDEDHRLAAAELCRRLDGLPLAIELAAVRLRTLTVQQILDRLGDRFTVLGEGDRLAYPHQRTLQATLDWSYELASDEQRVLWRCLSVFPGSFDLPAAEAVCPEEQLRARRILDVVDALVDKSVLLATVDGSGMRYRMLDSLRDYGLAKLRSEGNEPTLRKRHRDFYSDLCRRAWMHWTDREQPGWFTRLALEHDNLRAALDWCLENDGAEDGCRMTADMWLYWQARGHLTEGRRRIVALLDRLPADSSVRPRALWIAGYLAVAQTDVEAAIPLLEDSLREGTALGDGEVVAFACQYLGVCRLFSGDLVGAEESLTRAFQLHKSNGEKAAAFALADLAVTLTLGGEVARAQPLYHEALEMVERGGDPWTQGHCLWGLGLARWLDGSHDDAERAVKQALDLITKLEEGSGIALCLETLAWISQSRGEHQRSAQLQGAAQTLRESIPGPLPEPFHANAQRCALHSAEALGTERRLRLFDSGRRLDRAGAIALALAQAGERDPAPRTPGRTDALSRRELEVAELVAQGSTDKQIAARLFISQRTAESHVEHIRTKLGFRTRSQIAAWVAGRNDPNLPI